MGIADRSAPSPPFKGPCAGFESRARAQRAINEHISGFSNRDFRFLWVISLARRPAAPYISDHA
jgi:hypothetical protein